MKPALKDKADCSRPDAQAADAVDLNLAQQGKGNHRQAVRLFSRRLADIMIDLFRLRLQAPPRGSTAMETRGAGAGRRSSRFSSALGPEVRGA